MKLNLGCGSDKRDGWRNVDKYPVLEPDELVDLEQFPWPWPDNSVDEVLLRHVLEHLGAASETYRQIVQELWRVCSDRAKITVIVPHPRHDHYLNDPTHVRPITAAGLQMLSKVKNREWQQGGLANTPLGLIWDVDFEIEDVKLSPDEPWRGRLMRGEISANDLQQAARQFNNVVSEVTILLRAVKS